MTISNKAIIEAYKKGYVINKDGDILGLKGKVLNIFNHKGYYQFGIRIKKKMQAVQVHKFQAYFKFKNKMFENEIQVRHLDGNSLNNSWDNIEIGTQSDNMMDKPVELRKKWASHPKHDHLSIINDSKNGMSYAKIMKKHNISSKGTISFIINNSIATKT